MTTYAIHRNFPPADMYYSSMPDSDNLTLSQAISLHLRTPNSILIRESDGSLVECSPGGKWGVMVPHGEGMAFETLDRD